MLERSSRPNPFLLPFGLRQSVMLPGSKNHTFTHSLHSKITPYQAYFGKTPSLATLCLFGCKAFTHIQRVNQTKFGECAAHCINIGFAEEKRLTCSIAKSIGNCLNHMMLSLRKWRVGNKSQL